MDIECHHYVTAVPVLERDGNLREEKKNRKPCSKPGWQIRLESRIDAIRRKPSLLNVITECKKKQKYTKHQGILEPDLKSNMG